MRKLVVLAAVIGAPFASASAQTREALQAGMRQELNCLPQSAMALPDNSPQARTDEVLAGCKQRFGWDNPETAHALLVGRLSLEVQLARRELIDAGVDFEAVLRIWQALSREESASIWDASTRPDAARETSQAIIRRLLDAGIAPAQAANAGGTVVKMVQASSLAAEFIRLRIERAAGRRPVDGPTTPAG